VTDPFDHLSEGTKYLLDALSIATMLGALVSYLPSIAALLTVIWTLIRIYESKTVQGWLGKGDG
jgi:hypothetical protein